jgi:hypothetical protein
MREIKTLEEQKLQEAAEKYAELLFGGVEKIDINRQSCAMDFKAGAKWQASQFTASTPESGSVSSNGEDQEEIWKEIGKELLIEISNFNFKLDVRHLMKHYTINRKQVKE